MKIPCSRFTEIYEVKHSQFTDFNSVFSLVTKIQTLNPVSRKNPFHPLIWNHRHQGDSIILHSVSVENRVSGIYERYRTSQHIGLNVAFITGNRKVTHVSWHRGKVTTQQVTPWSQRSFKLFTQCAATECNTYELYGDDKLISYGLKAVCIVSYFQKKKNSNKTTITVTSVFSIMSHPNHD